ncbi:hypothetical protein [Bizionia paragorgiae]|uniref:Uncharacterized protein n=1 Tax=Bizionia paragorgiae TaxID=283786 RepID=A0A1H4ALR6_BIZPA|nr:hypothetical protein [Bizionia paragorgiae]MDX1270268.1 hypothetical protein [Bizionia paragorgiae]SEA36880.1 hypothetical protein SAMN04487990_11150 [Bizionia paragorgiae]
MKLFKIFQYAYLVFAVLFLYDAYENWGGVEETRAYSSLLLGALAIFMFFFRQKFNKKFDNKDQKK